jgi:hypothetical protein
MVLGSIIDCPKYDSQDFTGVAQLEAITVRDEEKGEVTIFAVNLGPREMLHLTAEFRGLKPLSVVEHVVLENEDPKVVNGPEREGDEAPLEWRCPLGRGSASNESYGLLVERNPPKTCAMRPEGEGQSA